MDGNYDNSASFYDRLSRLVFGDDLIKAQVYLLHYIPAGARVLIAGGGTGWILEEITRLHPAGLSITYVEISRKMTAISRSRNIGHNNVTFINEPIQTVSLPNAFDVVVTPFLFDNFKEENLLNVFLPIHEALKTGGTWLYTDFQLTGKWWQYALLKSMLLFFKVLCGIESWRMPNVEKVFKSYGYTVKDEKTFFGNFIHSQMLNKAS